MITDWKITPGEGVSGGAGPVTAGGGRYVLNTGSEKFNLIFAGIGAAVGGPASFTYSDSKTPSLAGNLVTSGYFGKPDVRLLTAPTDGLIISLGTAPRHFLPGAGDPNSISGGYLQLLMFGVTSETQAIASFAIDGSVGEPNGGFITGAYGYAGVASAAKGIDLGGAGIMKGTWIRI